MQRSEVYIAQDQDCSRIPNKPHLPGKLSSKSIFGIRSAVIHDGFFIPLTDTTLTVFLRTG